MKKDSTEKNFMNKIFKYDPDNRILIVKFIKSEYTNFFSFSMLNDKMNIVLHTSYGNISTNFFIPEKIIFQGNKHTKLNIKLDSVVANKINFIIEDFPSITIKPFKVNKIDNNKPILDLTNFNIIETKKNNSFINKLELVIDNDNYFNIIYPDTIGQDSNLPIMDLILKNANLPDNSILILDSYSIYDCYSNTKMIKKRSNFENLSIYNSNINTINNLDNRYLKSFTYQGDNTNQLEDINKNFSFEEINLLHSGIKNWNNNEYLNFYMENEPNFSKFIHIFNNKDNIRNLEIKEIAEHNIEAFILNDNINIIFNSVRDGFIILEKTHVLNFIHNNLSNYSNSRNNLLMDLNYSTCSNIEYVKSWKEDINLELYNDKLEDYNLADIESKDITNILDKYIEKYNEPDIIKAIVNNDQEKINKIIKTENKNIKALSENIDLYQFIKDKEMINFLYHLDAEIHLNNDDTKTFSDNYIKHINLLENLYLKQTYSNKLKKEQLKIKKINITSL